MANPNGQPFFVPNPPDLPGALSNTLLALIDQRVGQLIDHRFNDIEQRLQNIESVLRAEGRLAIQQQTAPQSQQQQSQQQTRQTDPLRSAQHQQQQQQQQVQQQQQQVQQQVQQVQVQQQQQHHHNPHHNPHQHPQPQQVQQQSLAQFQPNPPQSTQAQAQNQNGVVDTDPVMALANANAPGALTGPTLSMQQAQAQVQAQQQQQQQQQLPPAPSANLVPPIVPMDIPPENYPISSRATMQQELDQFTIPRGYSMRMSGTRDMGKGKRKIRWICFRAGEARYSEASKAAGLPERSSKKCNCPFKFECVETFRDSNMWVVHHHITPGTTTHNHPPSDPSEDPRSRKLPPHVAAEVDGWLRQGWQVSKIMTELKNRGFKNVLSRDLYNRRQQLKREDESGG